MAEVFYWILTFVLILTLLCLLGYQLILLVDLEFDYINPYDSTSRINQVWEIVYAKDGHVKELSNVMQLKGHKSAVTWLCFSPNSEQIITASKDGSLRIWNINVRYHLDEDPKTLKVFPIPLP